MNAGPVTFGYASTAASEGTTEAPGGTVYPSGDFNLDEFALGKIVDDGVDGAEFHSVVDLHDLYVSFNIQQSIHSPYLKMDVVFGESKQIFERFGSKGLQGEEFIRIRFSAPDRAGIENIFYVTGYEPVGKDHDDLGSGIVLHAVSKEKLINDITTVNRSVSGDFRSITEGIINDILNHPQYRTFRAGKYGLGYPWTPSNIAWFDDPQEVQNFIIPGYSPFGAMQMLCQRAFGGTRQGSMFMFFENNRGYNFVNVENILVKTINEDPFNPKNNPRADPSRIAGGGDWGTHGLMYDPKVSEGARYNPGFWNSMAYLSPLSMGNTLRKIETGAFANRVRTIDHVRKRFYDTSFNMQKEFPNLQNLGSDFNISKAFFNAFCDTEVDFAHIKDTTSQNESFEHIIGKRLAFQSLLTTFGYNTVVPGNTNMNVGDCAYITEFSESGPAAAKEGSMYSGYYLITELIHTVDRGKFNTTLSLAKDSLDALHKYNKEQAAADSVAALQGGVGS